MLVLAQQLDYRDDTWLQRHLVIFHPEVIRHVGHTLEKHRVDYWGLLLIAQQHVIGGTRNLIHDYVVGVLSLIRKCEEGVFLYLSQ